MTHSKQKHQTELTRLTRPRRAMALVGVMMILLFLLTMALIGIVSAARTDPGSLNGKARNAALQTRTRINLYGAQNMADSGVRAVMQWLTFQSSAPGNLNAFRPASITPFFGSSPNGNYDRLTLHKPGGSEVEGTADVRVFPVDDNDTATTRSYVIESLGTYNGKVQIVRAVAAQDTFAKYAFFAENAPVNTRFSSGTTVFNGPVHINGRNTDPTDPSYNPNAKIQILWKDNGTQSKNRIFRFDGENSFTTSVAESKVEWYRNNINNLSKPGSDNEWKHIALRSKEGVRYSTPFVEMPTESTKQRDAALGTPPAIPPTNKGVLVPKSTGNTTTGGMYINGDVDTMVFGASGSNNAVQTVTVYQTEGGYQIRTTITIDPYQNGGLGRVQVSTARAIAGNQPISKSSFASFGTTQNIVGTGNGMIYVAGNIGTQAATPLGGVSGKIANNVVSGGVVTHENNLSLVTDSDKKININGNLQYASGSGSPNVNSAVLGIVTKKVQITEYDNAYDGAVTANTQLGDVKVDATVFAFDTFDAVNPLTRNYPNPKSFTLTGGYIVNKSGTFAGVTADGQVLAGFNITRNYDSRLANRPPPYFPSTSNQYKIRSYQVVNSTL